MSCGASAAGDGQEVGGSVAPAQFSSTSARTAGVEGVARWQRRRRHNEGPNQLDRLRPTAPPGLTRDAVLEVGLNLVNHTPLLQARKAEGMESAQGLMSGMCWHPGTHPGSSPGPRTIHSPAPLHPNRFFLSWCGAALFVFGYQVECEKGDGNKTKKNSSPCPR